MCASASHHYTAQSPYYLTFRLAASHQDVAIYSQLVKLVLFSSAMHQTAFTCTSSLPFAIGQVQDAGLIFLSKIACEIADAMREDPPEHMLSTVLVTLSSSTALLGVALMLTGYWKLAGLVQYLPLPVSPRGTSHARRAACVAPPPLAVYSLFLAGARWRHVFRRVLAVLCFIVCFFAIRCIRWSAAISPSLACIASKQACRS